VQSPVTPLISTDSLLTPSPDSPVIGVKEYFIGVDTGGTYTDAAIIEAGAHTVLATAKAITTKGDLAVGVLEAIRLALAQLPHDISPGSVSLVSVSTTLATNAVVEGHGSAVGVLLIGFDEGMAARTGIAKAFPGVALAQVPGGHDHAGMQQQALDLDALAAAVDAMAPRVDAFAIAAKFAVRNPAHELQARELVVQRTGKPVTISTELSSSLDAPRRALTATLNARLVSRVSHLIDAVSHAMQTLGIACPLMIVKGDGTLALAEAVAKRPIETVLSGPAASLVGAQWLSGKTSFVMSDMGGTTTDLGLLINGRPRVTEEGAEVGGWRTMVKAVDVKTIGLGGDSEITLDHGGAIQVGPQRALPLSLLCARYPETLALLEADMADVDRGGSMHGKFVLLPFGAQTGRVQLTHDINGKEAALLARITAAPQPLRKLADSVASQRLLATLRKKGLIQWAAVTPSDASHVLDLQSNWSRQGALLGLQLLCRFKDMRQPNAERTQAFAQEIWSETVRLTSRLILECAAGISLVGNSLAEAQCAGQSTLGLVALNLSPTLPVVAVGGPVSVYYPEVGRRLHCEVVFAPHCDVANAVGAATGVVARQTQVVVEGDGSGLFILHSTLGSERFTDAATALAAATRLAEEGAVQAVVAMGAAQPQVTSSITKKYMPRAVDDRGLLEAIVVAEASGRPALRSAPANSHPTAH
jgi:N-methylhydantoinase A/oxoprolinase/acetone carboxylase beta subunit